MTLADTTSRHVTSTATSTVRSNTPSSQNSQDSVRGRGDAGTESDELWTSVFHRGNKGKGRAPLTEEQYTDLEKSTDGGSLLSKHGPY